MNQVLLDFYRGKGCDNKGRTIDEIWRWDHQKLESVHDYIQWLFPSLKPSAFNPDAPLLDDETVEVFRQDGELQQRLWKSLQLLLDFYGLELFLSCGFMARRADNYQERCANWQEPYRGKPNHNLLRLTRILEALRVLGHPGQSLALLYCLEEIAQEIPEKIPPTTVDYWRQAAGQS
jgi:hypothetical protein